MKVIKRDGRIVEYDSEKISIAIQKANKEVKGEQKASLDDIKGIIDYIEDLDKKRILVEDIQDIIEQKLMEIGKFELAKKYIVYRYTRALVRKANTTDESILGLIRNENKEVYEENLNDNLMLASTQRNYIAGEVSRDLTRRILLPEKISKAHEEGVLYFHNADYFVQPIFNCSLINIGDMLDNGTVMNGKMIETPKSFLSACLVTTQIIEAVACNQYGGQSVDLIHLGKYLRYSHDKFEKELRKEYGKKLSDEMIEGIVSMRIKYELASGIQTIQYQINTLMTTSGQSPFVTLCLHLDKDDPYIKENAMIIEEVLKQRIKGIKDEKGEFVTPVYPKLVYVLDEFNNLTGGDYDYLTELAVKCSINRTYPDYISAKKMRENYKGYVFSPMGSRNFLSPYKDSNGNYKWEGRFNQGVVSINLPQVALAADKDENRFFEELDRRLEICFEALMCRHYALLGTTSDISPVHWQYGAISRLAKGEKIDSLLKNGYSTLSLGYIGIYETTKLIKGVSQVEKEGHDFAIKLMKKLKETVEKWKDQTGIAFTLYGTPAKSLCYRFARIDKELFGNISEITDKGYYTNSYHIDADEQMSIKDKLLFESEFQNLSLGGAIANIDIKEQDEEKYKDLIKFIYENIQYAEFNNDEKQSNVNEKF